MLGDPDQLGTQLSVSSGFERGVLPAMATGANNAAIARELSLSPKTVRNYISNIFRKLQVADRAQAIVAAREAGIETPDPSTRFGLRRVRQGPAGRNGQPGRGGSRTRRR